jgi:hypothetical protein
MSLIFEDRRNRAQYPFVPDSKIFFTLNQGGKILKGNIIVTGTVVVSGGTTAGTIVGEGGPINLISRIKMFATAAAGSRYPGGTIVDCTPRSLLRYAVMQHNGKFIGEQSGSTLGNGANGTYFIYLSIPIYFADSTLRNNFSTALNVDLVDANGLPIYNSVQVEVDTADLTACFVGNNATVNWGGLTVQWDDTRLGLSGDTNVIYQEEHTQLIGAAQNRMLDPGMQQSGSYTNWLILAESLGSQYVLSDAIFQRLIASSGSFNFDEYAQDIRQSMLDNEWIDPSTVATGMFFFDWTEGTLNNANPAAGITAQWQVANPSGSNLDQLRIYTRRFYQPTPAGS